MIECLPPCAFDRAFAESAERGREALRAEGWEYCELERGDALYLPDHFWHCIESDPDTIGVSIAIVPAG